MQPTAPAAQHSTGTHEHCSGARTARVCVHRNGIKGPLLFLPTGRAVATHLGRADGGANGRSAGARTAQARVQRRRGAVPLLHYSVTCARSLLCFGAWAAQSPLFSSALQHSAGGGGYEREAGLGINSFGTKQQQPLY